MTSFFVKTLCIPGFLGDSSDFNWLSVQHDCIEIFKEDIYTTGFQSFANAVKQKYQLNGAVNAIGYSLGGRLLLNALLTNQDLFNKVVIISSHTGLASNKQRTERINADYEWANKFDNDLKAAFNDWQQQSIFENHQITRDLELLNPKSINHALTIWSLGNMEYLLPRLSSVNTPILWIVGETDEKFVKIAKEASNINKNIILSIVPSCGHRVMWQAPKLVDALVDDFFKH
jgi:2-succinyl-6-hydroxy-2,4-cyclohexadiene-1-carboxylate synthase